MHTHHWASHVPRHRKTRILRHRIRTRRDHLVRSRCTLPIHLSQTVIVISAAIFHTNGIFLARHQRNLRGRRISIPPVRHQLVIDPHLQQRTIVIAATKCVRFARRGRQFALPTRREVPKSQARTRKIAVIIPGTIYRPISPAQYRGTTQALVGVEITQKPGTQLTHRHTRGDRGR